MYKPPLIFKTSPVIYDESSEAKNNTALATSSGCPNLERGIISLYFSFMVSDKTSVISVSINPGLTALTFIFFERYSFAKDFVKPISADLVEE